MRAREKWRFVQKWRGKISVQLGISILLVNVVVMTVCYFLQYEEMQKILLEKDKEEVITRFEQAEYNIGTLMEQVDVVSRRLSLEYSFRRVSQESGLSDAKKIYYVNTVGKVMENILYHYAYLDSIIYYGKNGEIVGVLSDTDVGTFYLKDKDKQDWYYNSDIYNSLPGSKQTLKWFGKNEKNKFLGIYGTENEEEYYISAARRIIGNVGDLIINIDMDYFLEIFNTPKNDTVEQIYVIDDENIVVAAQNKELLGIEKKFTEAEEIQEGISKYIISDCGEKKQVIVYDISYMGWSLVSESLIDDVVRESNYIRNVLMMSCMLCVCITVVVTMWWVTLILRPLKQLEEEIKKVGEGQFGITIDNPPPNELGRVIAYFNRMSLSLDDMFRQNQIIEKEKRRLEMQTLRAQINPHLIYNVLNNIKWKAIFNNERNIAESVSLLAKFLQPVFKNQDIMCSLEEEMNYVKNYVEIMNLLRLGQYVIKEHIPQEYLSSRIIRFILQPVVENCILHGYPEDTDGKIFITMQQEGNDGILLVEDDGKGIEAARLEEVQQKLANNECINTQGIGIVNVNRRIKNQYGEAYGLSISNRAEKGTVVIIRIPMDK